MLRYLHKLTKNSIITDIEFAIHTWVRILAAQSAQEGCWD